VRQRRNFEYRLKRRVVKKIDFIRCLEYEMNLEALRQKRRERMGFDRQHKNMNPVSTNMDHAIIRRIHFIFDRAVNKFKGDVDLWKHFIEFAKSTHAKKALSRIYAQCIQLLPMETYFWIDAGYWEFQENHNMFSARSRDGWQRGYRASIICQRFFF
jgi:U3 small nucleolar RNA-associated protein 6